MKTIFVFLTILASALCATAPCGWTFHVSKPAVHSKSSSSKCSSFKVEHHFTFGKCKGGKIGTPVAGPVISTPIISTPIVSTPIISPPIVSTPIVSNPGGNGGGNGGAGGNLAERIRNLFLR